eukprot:scaffold11140_cov51-Cyclotella_meneghiniana.AAC.3
MVPQTLPILMPVYMLVLKYSPPMPVLLGVQRSHDPQDIAVLRPRLDLLPSVLRFVQGSEIVACDQATGSFFQPVEFLRGRYPQVYSKKSQKFASV